MKTKTRNMKIYKKYADREEWFETTEEEMLDKVEGSGAYAKGTALQALKDSGIIRTPFAFYSLNKSN